MNGLEQTIPDGYQQTEVGLIPDAWELLSFGELVKYIKGYPFKSSEYTDSGIRVVRVSDTSYSSIKNDNPTFVSQKSECKYKKWALKKGDLIFTTVGSKPPMYDSLVGKAILVEDKHEGFLLNQNAVLIKPQFEAENVSNLLFNHFRTERYIDHIEKIYRGNANQASITLEGLFEFKIPLPKDPKEQTAIANALSDIDALLSELEKLIAKKQAIKTATMQQLLTGKTRLPQFATYTDGDKKGQTKITKPSELGEIPEDWEVARMGDISNVNQGLQIKIEQRKSYQSEISKPYITIQSLKLTEPIEFIDEYSSAVCCVEDEILMTRTGNTGIVVTGVTGVFHNNFFKIVYQKSKLNKDFFVCFLRSSDSKKRILDKAGTSTIPDLNHNDFYSLPIILPSKKEQTAIATILSDMDEEIQALKQRLSKTRQIKQGMMQELLTGKTRLPFDKVDTKSQGEPNAD